MSNTALETALADVFNREFQSHGPDARWEDVLRCTATRVAFVLHPDSPADRALFIDSASLSGLFAGE
jgi:hypothetical protein